MIIERDRKRTDVMNVVNVPDADLNFIDARSAEKNSVLSVDGTKRPRNTNL